MSAHRIPIVVGNWKMHTRLSDATVLATAIRNGLTEVDGVEAVLCPPAPWIVPVQEVIEKRPAQLKLGAQNCYYGPEGAVTGEVTPAMLKGVVDYIIVGHSERRRLFDEDDHLNNEKALACLAADLRVILCVGEQEKRHNLSNAALLKQLALGLKDAKKSDADKMVIAYEPVWAIGTGEAASGTYAAEKISAIRNALTEQFGEEADKIRVIYGGSVTPSNVEQYAGQLEIDGCLPGSAALKAREFIEICKAFAR